MLSLAPSKDEQTQQYLAETAIQQVELYLAPQPLSVIMPPATTKPKLKGSKKSWEAVESTELADATVQLILEDRDNPLAPEYSAPQIQTREEIVIERQAVRNRLTNMRKRHVQAMRQIEALFDKFNPRWKVPSGEDSIDTSREDILERMDPLIHRPAPINRFNTELDDDVQAFKNAGIPMPPLAREFCLVVLKYLHNLQHEFDPLEFVNTICNYLQSPLESFALVTREKRTLLLFTKLILETHFHLAQQQSRVEIEDLTQLLKAQGTTQQDIDTIEQEDAERRRIEALFSRALERVAPPAFFDQTICAQAENADGYNLNGFRKIETSRATLYITRELQSTRYALFQRNGEQHLTLCIFRQSPALPGKVVVESCEYIPAVGIIKQDWKRQYVLTAS